ncbi:Putative frataxin superfamily CyaY-like iron donor protein [Candidatus Trichorickettsia mobilis]|uniref:Frataxin superfamily CyaY-like iron donor protein n=2 Tax=Candidatus Trichorickettsia mobilis TaxID=1346319 RepID=A0ABZ0UWK2_9RICK|nr:Putative frataxin superfamily CyaY-like iron donor protein [Candidatus Trichorickettsia mobilis]
MLKNNKMHLIEFSNIAEQVLLFIADTIESFDSDGLIDVDFNNDMINISTDKGIFIINKHSASMQIWLASPISGPYHFSYANGKWYSHAGSELFEILTNELQIIFKP